jgi:hypothetical protein
MNSQKRRGVVVLAGMTTLGIVPKKPVRQLSGSIIPQEVGSICAIQVAFPILRHDTFFLASVANPFADIHGYFAMEERNA